MFGLLIHVYNFTASFNIPPKCRMHVTQVKLSYFLQVISQLKHHWKKRKYQNSGRRKSTTSQTTSRRLSASSVNINGAIHNVSSFQNLMMAASAMATDNVNKNNTKLSPCREISELEEEHDTNSEVLHGDRVITSYAECNNGFVDTICDDKLGHIKMETFVQKQE